MSSMADLQRMAQTSVRTCPPRCATVDGARRRFAFWPRILVAFAASVPSQPAASQAQVGQEIGYYLAQELEARCRTGTTADPATCFAYVAAVYDTVRSYQIWLGMREFCVPADTPQSELRRAFLDHLQQNPDDREAQAASVIVMALRQRYPCPAEAPAPAPSQSQ